jgi:ketosteroid isomerase-like protein
MPRVAVTLTPMLSDYARDAAWDMNDAGTGTFDGVAAIRGFFEDWIGNWEDYRTETEEILDVGHEVVFVAYLEDGRPVGGEVAFISGVAASS